MPDVSVVVPAYNEAKVLPGFSARIDAVRKELARSGLSSELVLVNDGSSDDTLAIMRALAMRTAGVRVVDLARRFGHQPALMAGLDHARGRCVAVMDVDLQDPPELLLELARRWRAGYEVVYGVRRRRSGDSIFKRATAHAFYRMLRVLCGEPVRNDIGDFYLVDRKVADVLRAGRSTKPFLRGVLSQAGYRSFGVSYDRSSRWAGTTKYPLRRMLSLAADAVTMMTFRPLRLIAVLGFLLACVGALALIPSQMDVRAVLILTSGVHLMAIGLLGEYLGRMHEVVMGRPIYLVREVIDRDALDLCTARTSGKGSSPEEGT